MNTIKSNILFVISTDDEGNLVYYGKLKGEEKGVMRFGLSSPRQTDV